MTHNGRSVRSLRPRTRAVAVAAALAMAATFTAACTSEADGQGGSGASAVATDSSPGVTETTVKVGIVIADRGSLGDRLGFATIQPGDVPTRTAGVNALVNYINTNGGVGGRQIEPVIRVYESVNDSAEAAEALCRQFTQDDQVFAVILDGQLQNNVRPCYQAGRAIMLDGSVKATDNTEFERYNGYLWSPSLTEYSSFARTQIRNLAGRGFFNGNTGIQLLVADDEVSRRVSTNVVRPELAAAGVTTIGENFIDGTNQGTLGATVAAAQIAGTSAGYNRALAVGGARIMPLAFASFEAQEFTAIWGMGTFDNPFNLENNREGYVSERYPGLVGIGTNPLIDTADPALPFPDPAQPGQVLCKQIVDQAPGAQPPQGQRANYEAIFKTCDSLFFLKAALDKAGSNLNVETFKEGAFQITNEFQPAISFTAAGGPGVYAPSNSARGMVFDTNRLIFVYDSPNFPLALQ